MSGDLTQVATAEMIDRRTLDAFLSASVPELRAHLPVLRVERTGQGQSNMTFRVVLSGGRTVILRRPPPGPLPPSAHDVLREFRVMHSLWGTKVPVPRMLACSDDPEVLGVPFFLMEAVEGDAIRFELPAVLETAEPAALIWRKSIGEQLVDALVALHTTDVAAVGLADLGRPSGYLARQIKRWKSQLEFAQVRPADDLDWVTGWLEAQLPPERGAASGRIVHGDYKLDNVIFSHERPPRLLAVVDWEMATLGDPLADLGWLLAFWRQADDPPPELQIIPRVTEAAGFSVRAELTERYAERMQQPLPRYLPFYVVMALWKMAVLLEGHWARHERGTAEGFDFSYLKDAGPAFWARIRREASGSGNLETLSGGRG